MKIIDATVIVNDVITPVSEPMPVLKLFLMALSM